MLQGPLRVGIARRSAVRLWLLMATDLMTVLWMQAVGSWLDHTSRLTAIATLGGHHQVVLVIGLVGFGMLATLAILTDGFSRTDRRLTIATNVACVLSVVALVGLVAFVLAALLSRVLFGRLRP